MGQAGAGETYFCGGKFIKNNEAPAFPPDVESLERLYNELVARKEGDLTGDTEPQLSLKGRLNPRSALSLSGAGSLSGTARKT